MGADGSPSKNEITPTVVSSAGRAIRGRRDEILYLAAERFASAGYSETSLQHIADAGGVLPGSLYHHFESKEAIAEELIREYHTELEVLGRSVLTRSGPDSMLAIYDSLLGLVTAIAESSFRHQAAVRLSIYEFAAGDRPAGKTPKGEVSSIELALREMIARGREVGLVRSTVDPDVFSQQLYTAIRRVGVSDPSHAARVPDLAGTLLHILLGGVASKTPADPLLDRSDAVCAAKDRLRMWRLEPNGSADEKSAQVHSAARSEFARRGYEAATIRDIAKAAGMSNGSLYRIVDSKETLLRTIMASYYSHLSTAYKVVMAAGSGVIEQIDALLWVNIKAMDMFSAEFEIQHSWIRQTPPSVDISSDALNREILQIGDLIAGGLRSGDLRVWEVDSSIPSSDLVIAAMHNLLWLPVDIIEKSGCRSALRHSRRTTLRGAGPTRLGKAIGPRTGSRASRPS